MGRPILLLLLACAAARGEDSAALLREAESLATRGDYARARRIYERVAQEFPATNDGLLAARRARPNAFLRAVPLWTSGPPERRIDVYIMGEGFPMEDQGKFDKWAQTTVEILFKVDCLRRYRHFFNLRAMNLLSREDGVDDPQGKRAYDTALDAKSLGGGGQVYIDTGRVGEMLQEVSDHDELVIVLVQKGVLGTGGGGIATTGRPDRTTIVHEWGHAFGALLDEYTFGAADREQGFGARGPNISDTPDPTEVPWAHFLARKVKGVGIVEGGAGLDKGRWRPTASGCAMGAAGSVSGFCPVCRERIVLSIYAKAGGIDESEPPDRVVKARPGEARTFRVRPMRVEGPPDLKVAWRVHRLGPEESIVTPVDEEAQAVSEIFALPGQLRPTARKRVPLPEERGEERRGARAPNGFEELELEDLAPGIYEVTCFVEDPTPWLLEDPRELRKDARQWFLQVGLLPGDAPVTPSK